jgi:peptide/nickel transport system ATP-binding protein
MSQDENLLEVKSLRTSFETERGKVTAVDGVSFKIGPGEIVGIVGESGCGKSVTAQSIMRLLDEKGTTTYEGEIIYKGEDILKLKKNELRRVRGNEIAMIFQDPLSSLNPVVPIGKQLIESIMLHQKISKRRAWKKGIEMLTVTGIPSPEERMMEYPHQLSGGMRQRVMISMALSCNPSLLIADEPTTALDVTIQSQILELILKISREFKMGVMLITHDLGVVSQICDRAAVMYLGKIVEEAESEDLFSRPLHPYTKGLLRSMPSADLNGRRKLMAIEGNVPSVFEKQKGCSFASRCSFKEERCTRSVPEISKESEKHKVRCFFYREIEGGL